MTVALAPNAGRLVVGLVDQLWRVPAAAGPPGADDRGRNGAQPALQSRRRLDVTSGSATVSGTSRCSICRPPSGARLQHVFRRDRARVQPRRACGRIRVEPHGAFLPLVVDLASGVETQLTEEPGDASFPSASELGPIAYLLRRGTQQELRVLLPSGVTTELVSRNVDLGPPSWRPGGGVVVFSQRDGTTGSRLRMIVLGDPIVDKPITDSEDIFLTRPAWLSSAEFIYALDGQLWRRAIALQNRQPVHVFAGRVVEARPPPADLPLLDEAGPQIARGIAGVTTTADGRRTAFPALGDLWLSERGALRRLTDDTWVDLDPAFAPDGGSLVFASERSGQFELWRIDLRGGVPSQITFGALQPRHPAVAATGVESHSSKRTRKDPARASASPSRSRATGRVATVATGLTAAKPSWGTDGKTLTLRVAAAPAGTVSALGSRSAPRPPRHSGRNPARKPHPNAQALGDVRSAPPAAPEDYVVGSGGCSTPCARSIESAWTSTLGADGSLRDRRARRAADGGQSDRRARRAAVVVGFVDVHAHQSVLTGERLGRMWLAYGVTTVREVAPDVA